MRRFMGEVQRVHGDDDELPGVAGEHARFHVSNKPYVKATVKLRTRSANG